jgi:outer membrane protein assembly factor BamB
MSRDFWQADLPETLGDRQVLGIQETMRRARWAFLVALISLVAAACDWTTFGFNAAHTRFNADDEAPKAAALPGLTRVAKASTGAAVNSSPATADNLVYVVSTDGILYALSEKVGGCGKVLCRRWTASIGAGSDSSPAIANGVLYVGSAGGTLYAFDAAGTTNCSGTPVVCEPLWQAATGGPLSSPVVISGRLHVGSGDGNLYTFDAAGNTNCAAEVCLPLWTAATGGPVASSPAVANDVVYVGSDDGNLYAFDATGTTNCAAGLCLPLWTGSTGGAITSSPSVSPSTVYVGSDDTRLYAFSTTDRSYCSAAPVTCTPVWTGATGGPVRSSPAVANDLVYVGSDDGLLHAFDASHSSCSEEPVECAPLWTGATGGAVWSSPAVAQSIVYVGSDDGALYAFDALSGAQLWREETGGAVRSSPATTDGFVYVGSAAGTLNAYWPVVAPIAVPLTARPLTHERLDRFSISDAEGVVTSSAAGKNKGGNSRLVFWRGTDASAADVESCATWTSQSRVLNQQGIALRARTSDGNLTAITVTKNVYFGAEWIFNVHVWDTSEPQPATQIAGFNLEATFRPQGNLVPLPWRMCARAVGTTVSFVVWPTSIEQPAWDDPAYGGSVTLPDGYADAGAAGWYFGHLQKNDAVAYTDLSVTPISAPTFATRGASLTPPEEPSSLAILP